MNLNFALSWQILTVFFFLLWFLYKIFYYYTEPIIAVDSVNKTCTLNMFKLPEWKLY